MKRFLFALSTLMAVYFLDLLCNRYLIVFGVRPNVIFLFVLAIGFVRGPLMAESLGFFWGLFTDAAGVNLFGLHMFLLPLAGYIAGSLRRRVASERPAAQVAIALIGTVAYVLISYGLLDAFDIAVSRSMVKPIVLGSFFNVLLVTAVFWIVERWIYIWTFDVEHI